MRNRLIYLLLSTISLIAEEAAADSSTNSAAPKAMTLDSLRGIACNPRLSYRDRLQLFYSNNFCEEVNREEQTALINTLLSESKRRNDPDGLLIGYSHLAYINDEWGHTAQSKVYLDSANLYADEATNTLSLARYHYLKGMEAIRIPYGRKEGHREFETAMYLYLQSGYAIQYLSFITYNIAVYSTHQPDTIFTKSMIDRVEYLLEQKYSAFNDFTLSMLKASLYISAYKGSGKVQMLDSALYYENRLIALYSENSKQFGNKCKNDVIQSYLRVAEYSLLKQNTDTATINKCINEARLMSDAGNDFIISRIYYTEALSLFHANRYVEAENKVKEAEDRLEANIHPSYSIAYCELHSNILAALGRYREANDYNKQKNTLKAEMLMLEIHELERLYNTEKEERKIEQLETQSQYQIKTATMLVITALLLVLTIILLCLWFSRFNKNLKRRSALIKAEKDEAALNLKIKEAQAMSMQLEKYEVLSAYRLKELELEGKNKTILQLQRDKQNLDNQIEIYSHKINELINNHNEKTEPVKSETAPSSEIIDSIAQLLRRKLPQRNDYIDTLPLFDAHYIATLKRTYEGNLSVPYIKYCICLAIGMSIAEIAECFSIEQSSVHMVRYRLKKKFGLASNDDLVLFLRQLNSLLAAR